MIDDPIIEELHEVKDELSRRFQGDAHFLFAFLREGEKAERRPVVVLEPGSGRPPESPSAPQEGGTPSQR